jgi:Fe-S protein assembly chaperone HscA
MPTIVGIDLGTTHSLAAVMEHPGGLATGIPRVIKDSQGRVLLPSAVTFQDGEPVALGYDALDRLTADPASTVVSVKRFMGRSLADLHEAERRGVGYALEGDEAGVLRLRVGGKTLTPPEVSALILRELKRRTEAELDESITQAVVTVPAYFDDGQRQATKDAGRLAGVEVLRLVNEPTAASLAYGLHRLTQGVIAVYDLGGGTFDISILKVQEGVFEVLATAGNTQLGGDDWDRRLAEHVRVKLGLPDDGPTRAHLKHEAEVAKRELTTQESTTLRGVTITRAEFEALTRDLLETTSVPCRQAVADAKLIHRIDEVVLVGGSTRMPMVREHVRTIFNKEPLCTLNPDEVVAIGAAVQADILAGQNDEFLLLDVAPLSLGLETMGGTVAKLVHRNQTIPVTAKEYFTTYADGQTAFDLHVLQGEREMARDCRSLARFKLSGIPPMPAGIPRLEVTFLINPDGILEVTAHEERSGAESKVEVKPSYGLTDEQVEQMLFDAMEHAEEDFEERLLIEARVEADRVLLACAKALTDDSGLLQAEERPKIEAALASLEEAKKGTDRNVITARTEELDAVTKPWAERRMDAAIQAALAGRKAGEVAREGR